MALINNLSIKGTAGRGYQILFDGKPVDGCIDCKLHLEVNSIPEVTLTLYAMHVDVDLEGGVETTESNIV